MTAIYRDDYRPPDFRVEQVRLDFDIRERTTITAELDVVRASDSREGAPLVLDGRDQELLSVGLGGRVLPESAYERTDNSLTIAPVPDRFTLKLVTRIDPESNASLEGLYRSGPMLCTQCEAHGFSRMTYFPDRPDVLAKFRTRIEADQAHFPVLLSNGDCVESGACGKGRHFAVWDDPHPKPCYLFALVAGDLACVEDRFRTLSGRDVGLRFYVDHGNEGLVSHAMDSLKRAMRWDEETYGLEYDLDTYMVVAARDFNMGAMENKGLNLFNAAYVLASPETATDADYDAIEAVIGHEYFHNWTGNRVTCRDWFQLSLKEGLTVFREQQFCAAMGSPGVKRVQDVRALLARQFPEDAGPMAHSVRPDSYHEVNNFYTATVYEKGAELIRMIETLEGERTFVSGVQEYLRRNDGRAATIEDFLDAHAKVSGLDLDGFRRWYAQAGTPELTVTDEYRPDEATYVLKLRQATPPTPGQGNKSPVPVPVRFRLLDGSGTGIHAVSDSPALRGADLILLDAESAELRFTKVAVRPTPSLLRGFSAPVKLRYGRPDAELAHLLGYDDDPYVRWSAAEQLVMRCFASGARDGSVSALIDAFASLAARPMSDKALLAELLRLPGEAYVVEQIDSPDPARVGETRDRLRQGIARALTGPFSVWAQWASEGRSAESAGKRALSNLALWYLAATGTGSVLDLCVSRARESRNMTLAQGAVAALRDIPGIARERAFEAFFERAAGHPLVVDKWFALQASSVHPDAAAHVQELLRHPGYDARNPNRVRSVLGAFARENPRGFHAPDGSGYRLVAGEIVRLDAANPQLAARLFDGFMLWRRLPEALGALARGQIEEMARQSGMSPDLREKIAKALA